MYVGRAAVLAALICLLALLHFVRIYTILLTMYGITKDAKQIVSRLKRIQGQLVGVEKMIASDVYCIDIITQTSAIKQAISALEDAMLESHISCCLADNSTTRKKKSIKQLSEEIIKVYKLKRK